MVELCNLETWCILVLAVKFLFNNRLAAFLVKSIYTCIRKWLLFLWYFSINNSELLFQCYDFTEIRKNKSTKDFYFVIHLFFYFVSVFIVGIAEGETILWFRREIIDLTSCQRFSISKLLIHGSSYIVLHALYFLLNVM